MEVALLASLFWEIAIFLHLCEAGLYLTPHVVVFGVKPPHDQKWKHLFPMWLSGASGNKSAYHIECNHHELGDLNLNSWLPRVRQAGSTAGV